MIDRSVRSRSSWEPRVAEPVRDAQETTCASRARGSSRTAKPIGGSTLAVEPHSCGQKEG